MSNTDARTGQSSGYASSYGSWSGSSYTSYGYGYAAPTIDLNESLAPLMKRLAAYDKARLKLEDKGGVTPDLERLAKLLGNKFTMKGRYGENKKVSLTKQSELRQALLSVDGTIYLDIRQRPKTQMPVYYLCRVQHDYWNEYGLVVEDLYMSPGYPLNEPRFVKLMRGGHEVYFLRVSQFRKAVTAALETTAQSGADRLGTTSTDLSWHTDQMLYDLGRHVFQAAWHEDQLLGIMAAQHLQLPNFRQALELLYLNLSGDLHGLRHIIDAPMLNFFATTYEQPAIHALLTRLPDLEGNMLGDLPDKAIALYQRLQDAFGQFLGTNVQWGQAEHQTALWQLLYGNFNHLDLVAQGLQGDPGLAQATHELETKAKTLIAELLSVVQLDKLERDQAQPVC